MLIHLVNQEQKKFYQRNLTSSNSIDYMALTLHMRKRILLSYDNNYNVKQGQYFQAKAIATLSIPRIVVKCLKAFIVLHQPNEGKITQPITQVKGH